MTILLDTVIPITNIIKNVGYTYILGTEKLVAFKSNKEGYSTVFTHSQYYIII